MFRPKQSSTRLRRLLRELKIPGSWKIASPYGFAMTHGHACHCEGGCFVPTEAIFNPAVKVLYGSENPPAIERLLRPSGLAMTHGHACHCEGGCPIPTEAIFNSVEKILYGIEDPCQVEDYLTHPGFNDMHVLCRCEPNRL